MLRIAVVANNYDEGKRYINYKFKDKIEKINLAVGVWILKNEDEIHLCYGENSVKQYISIEFDAYVLTPQYESLEDVIRHRAGR